jgi:hypothetical protein
MEEENAGVGLRPAPAFSFSSRKNLKKSLTIETLSLPEARPPSPML